MSDQDILISASFGAACALVGIGIGALTKAQITYYRESRRNTRETARAEAAEALQRYHDERAENIAALALFTEDLKAAGYGQQLPDLPALPALRPHIPYTIRKIEGGTLVKFQNMAGATTLEFTDGGLREFISNLDRAAGNTQ